MNATSTAKSLIKDSPASKISSGCSAKFIRIDDKSGIKYYESKLMRDFTYKIQKRAHKYGVAPKVGSKFTTTIDGDKVYGYITETIMYTHKEQYLKDIIRSVREKDVPGYYELINILENKVKITIDDMHWANIGWLPNGQLVAIDFSEVSDKLARKYISGYPSE
jgi:hypothetical protein